MSTVVDRLVTPIDNIRSKLAEQIGHRPWTVRLVWTEWSGGSRGQGTESIASTLTLDPPPNLRGQADRELTLTGLQEQGTLDVSEVSLALSAEQLTGGTLGVQQDFYWEIDFGDGTWRRYVVASQPMKDIEGSFGWRLTLRRCEGCQ